MERTCDPQTAGEDQSILFVDQRGALTSPTHHGRRAQYRNTTDAQYEARQKRSACATPDDLTLQIDLTQPAPYFHTVAFTWVFFR